MRKTGLINNVSSKSIVPSIHDMQVLDEQSKAYFNFINSLKSESTRKSYTYCIEKFLGHYEKDLDQFLSLSQDEMTNLIIKYFIENKISYQYKNLMNSTLKHACEINDVVLNWKKIKKFIMPFPQANDSDDNTNNTLVLLQSDVENDTVENTEGMDAEEQDECSNWRGEW